MWLCCAIFLPCIVALSCIIDALFKMSRTGVTAGSLCPCLFAVVLLSALLLFPGGVLKAD
jgi:hypothetical protein